jgi:hypothetical protein
MQAAKPRAIEGMQRSARAVAVHPRRGTSCAMYEENKRFGEIASQQN